MSKHSKNKKRGLNEHYTEIKEKIRKSCTIQARLTEEEKSIFDNKRGTLSESAFIRKLIEESN